MRGNGKKWAITPNRLLRREEVEALQKCAMKRARRWQHGKSSRVLEHVVLEIALGSGLRVAEIAGLACGDVSLGELSGSILVRNGKGGKRRTVVISARLCRVLKRHIHWKNLRNQSLDHSAPLLASTQTEGQISTRALQKMFRRLQEAAGVSRHRFHDLRPTYGSFLLRASGNDLVFVKDQMGHADLSTTAIYLHALNAEKAVNALYS